MDVGKDSGGGSGIGSAQDSGENAAIDFQAQDLAVGLGQVWVRILARIRVRSLALDFVKILLGVLVEVLVRVIVSSFGRTLLREFGSWGAAGQKKRGGKGNEERKGS